MPIEIYKCLPTKECVEYMKSFGITLGDFKEVSIPSGTGNVYKLPTGEVVLIPTDFDMEYSGFVFTNMGELKKMILDDYFPVLEKDLSIWEIERNNLKEIPKSISLYKSFLTDKVNLSKISAEKTVLEKIYNSIVKLIGKKYF